MQDPKSRQKSPSGHHPTTLSGYVFATKASEKNLLSSNISSTCPHNMVNFGPLAAEIVSLVLGTPGNFNGFRVLAALLHSTLVVCVSQAAAFNRGRHLYSAGRPSCWALAHISSWIWNSKLSRDAVSVVSCCDGLSGIGSRARPKLIFAESRRGVAPLNVTIMAACRVPSTDASVIVQRRTSDVHYRSLCRSAVAARSMSACSLWHRLTRSKPSSVARARFYSAERLPRGIK